MTSKDLSLDRRLLVERLLNTCLVPYQLPPQERMRKLYQLFATIDENAGKAFIELQKHQLAVRKCVADLVELHRKPENEERDRDISCRLGYLAKFLPDPLKVQEYLRRFSQHMLSDPQLIVAMETVVAPDASCKKSVEAVTLILKKLGNQNTTNLYYNTVKMLLERVSNVMVDRVALEVLVSLVEGSLKGDLDTLEDLELPADIAVEKGLKLLFVSHLL